MTPPKYRVVNFQMSSPGVSRDPDKYRDLPHRGRRRLGGDGRPRHRPAAGAGVRLGPAERADRAAMLARRCGHLTTYTFWKVVKCSSSKLLKFDFRNSMGSCKELLKEAAIQIFPDYCVEKRDSFYV